MPHTDLTPEITPTWREFDDRAAREHQLATELAGVPDDHDF